MFLRVKRQSEKRKSAVSGNEDVLSGTQEPGGQETESRGIFYHGLRVINTDKAGDKILVETEKFLVLVGAHRFD